MEVFWAKNGPKIEMIQGRDVVLMGRNLVQDGYGIVVVSIIPRSNG